MRQMTRPARETPRNTGTTASATLTRMTAQLIGVDLRTVCHFLHGRVIQDRLHLGRRMFVGGRLFHVPSVVLEQTNARKQRAPVTRRRPA